MEHNIRRGEQFTIYQIFIVVHIGRSPFVEGGCSKDGILYTLVVDCMIIESKL